MLVGHSKGALLVRRVCLPLPQAIGRLQRVEVFIVVAVLVLVLILYVVSKL